VNLVPDGPLVSRHPRLVTQRGGIWSTETGTVPACLNAAVTATV
jgi:hypothetical protein